MESILKALEELSLTIQKSKNKEGLFQISKMNDPKIEAFKSRDSNPVLNSILSKDGKKFFFINPTQASIKLEWNESIFFSRAVGFRNDDGLTYVGNQLYTSVPRNNESDLMTKYDVYAITGLKSSLDPSTEQETNLGLGISLSGNWKALNVFRP